MLPKVGKPQRQLKDEKSNGPITLPEDYLSDGLNCGSLVEFKEHNDIIRGVIRWMGYTGDPQKIIAGIEVVMLPAHFHYVTYDHIWSKILQELTKSPARNTRTTLKSKLRAMPNSKRVLH